MSSKRKLKNDFILIKEILMKKEEQKIKASKISNKYKLINESEKIGIKSKCKNKIKNVFKNKKSKISKKVIINLGALIYNLLAFLFYYLSLEGCFKSQTECIPLLSTFF